MGFRNLRKGGDTTHSERDPKKRLRALERYKDKLDGQRHSKASLSTMVYEIHGALARIIGENEKPSLYAYHDLIRSYIALLRECEIGSNTGYLLSRYVEPRFDGTGFLEGRNVYEILKDLPDSESIKADYQFLQRLRTQGISRQEVEGYNQVFYDLDEFRTTFHNEIRIYAQGLGLTDFDVMVDITHGYHCCPGEINHDQKELIVNIGTLLIHDLFIGESPFQVSDDAPEWIRNDVESNRKRALELLELHLDPDNRKKGTYRNRKSRNRGEGEDMRLLKEIESDNPDLPVSYYYSPSHCAHGAAVFRLVLVISLQDISDTAANPAARTEELSQYLRNKIPSLF